MAIKPPTAGDLAEIAGHYGFHLTSHDLESFRALVTDALASYDTVERLYLAQIPEPPSRSFQWPGTADNELGAWYVTSEIKGASDGPLAGRRVPIKNTIDHLGPITRTVRDAALLLGVLAGRDGLDPRQREDAPPGDYLAELDAGVAGLRIGVVDEGFAIPGLSQPGVDETVRAAVRTL